MDRGFFYAWPLAFIHVGEACGALTRMNTNQKRIHTNIIHKDLSYALQGCLFKISNEYGTGHKEKVYQNLLADYLNDQHISVEKEKSINVYSNKTRKMVGTYRPDLVVDNKIIVEVKATTGLSRKDEKQLYYYLKNSDYELGYLVNFGTPKVYIKRIVFTNDRKWKQIQKKSMLRK